MKIIKLAQPLNIFLAPNFFSFFLNFISTKSVSFKKLFIEHKPDLLVPSLSTYLN